LTTLILLPSFHALTKCKFRNPFLLIFMQIGRGVGCAMLLTGFPMTSSAEEAPWIP
jgi:hypothetical protein